MNNCNLIINHRVKVKKLSEQLKIRGKNMLSIDVNRWGISEPFSDPENSTIHRSNLFSLSVDTFKDDDYEINHQHYINAQYRSIHDY